MKSKLIRLIGLAVLAAGIWLAWPRLFPKQSVADGWPGYGEGEFVYIASPIGGELENLLVKRGDQVNADAVIFELDRTAEKAASEEATETLNRIQTELDKAKLDYDRARTLQEKKVIAPENFDAAVQALLGAQHAAAAQRKAIDQANWSLEQKRQTSPVKGLVYDTYFRPGEYVPAGKPVAALLPPEYLKVRFFVPETDLGRAQVGAPIEIAMDGLDHPLRGRISFVSPQAEYTLPIIYSRENRAKLVFLVEGSLLPEDAPKLHPGAPVAVRLSQPKTSVAN